MDKEFIQLREFLYLLKKKWALIVFIIAICLISTIAITKYVIKPVYESKTKVFVGKEINNESTYDQWEIQMYQQLMQTYVELASTNNLIESALESINLDKDVEDVLENLSVVQKENTQILEISYKSIDSKESFDVVNAITNEFIKVSRDIIPNVNIEIIDDAQIAKEPLTNNLLRNLVVAFIGGCVLSVSLVLLMDFFNNTFNSKEDVERNLGLPIIGVIPRYNDD
ncbi:YveK family protein [Clostridium celatum]|uniref:Chain length determinant protein n=1 Tax=Clostridium celatum DSM 1785 TaxID=545697 RepID=L1QMW8_9CLOT|nr:Wzz/FepE/Etk N-terminal domain-containing protein [Clostridium celatum]EKY29070.1 chain length determinant protein [Clostridium celatum DSM 1785]MCE9654373.1 Wzz/FepE/Etk N-terminal domain-containing protein [Clostridium celatum]MDU2265605.1 Wzz/FepE/Etk N-terminal domain-containing protein [Clostridium celatum]MDU3724420.1 Wzz/FepE/Etk N-terminal domain-containing protein [Clostridium celatum]MDU6295461.1 Wzz/FepE/Etk N-terminal domain-containing protein [Clostridium celatum]